jgi:hypothetical protein
VPGARTTRRGIRRAGLNLPGGNRTMWGRAATTGRRLGLVFLLCVSGCGRPVHVDFFFDIRFEVEVRDSRQEPVSGAAVYLLEIEPDRDQRGSRGQLLGLTDTRGRLSVRHSFVVGAVPGQARSGPDFAIAAESGTCRSAVPLDLGQVPLEGVDHVLHVAVELCGDGQSPSSDSATQSPDNGFLRSAGLRGERWPE